MDIRTYFGNSCAVSAISELGDLKNAKEAMKIFCRHELGSKDDFGSVYSKLACFYVFSAGPEVPAGQPGSSHHSKAWVRYGTEFAEFIEENELGEIATTGQKKNLKHHPSTTAQVWIWSPDQKALEKWWTAAQDKEKKGRPSCGKSSKV